MQDVVRRTTVSHVAIIPARVWSWPVLLTVAVLFVSSSAMAEEWPDICAGAKGSERSVAITFDDLPFVGAGEAGAGDLANTASEANAAILEGLEKFRSPATGFVVEKRVDALGDKGLELLALWNGGRLELGNHTFSHADSNDLGIDDFRCEAIKGEAPIAPLARKAGRSPRFFRFPYNHVGDTPERRFAFETLLRERGYQLAASTIDTSDYIFDAAYERALAEGKGAVRRKIEDAYVDYSREEIAYYAALNKTVLGCEPPAIMLLHVNRINAAVIERLLAIFEGEGYRFVSLDEAQMHPAYERSPDFATKYGPMWGYRWARERGIKVDGSKEQEPPAWVSSYTESGETP